jgi:predicted acetyltransferase
MSLDFSKCVVRQPTGETLREMYRILWEMFPYDRPVYEEMLRTNKPFYTLISYALYEGEEFVGHAGIMPLRMWMNGRVLEVVGVGAVATVPKFRRLGVAHHLLTCCTDVIDQRRRLSVLYTELPRTYLAHGFEVVTQHYSACAITPSVWGQAGYELQLLEALNSEETAAMSGIYSNRYPNYNGKIDRDESYWDLYRMLFNPYPKPRIFLGRRGGKVYGYARFDQEDDRITITEMCCSPDNAELAEALLKNAWDYAARKGIALCSFALPPEHFVWPMLRQKGIKLAAEPGGVRREVFMARPTPGEPLAEIRNLQWSLADKF